MNMMKKNGGFTLVELIVVIAILAILAGVAVPAYSGYIQKANEAADITTCDAIQTAAFAALATKGDVTKIVIKNDKTVVATCNGADVTLTTANANDTYDDDFKLFYTAELPTAFKHKAADGKTAATTATWEKSTGEWKFS